MGWRKKAPTKEGYYWYLPEPVGKYQAAPTVMHRDSDGDWTFVGNECTMKASELRGRWWPVALEPPNA